MLNNKYLWTTFLITKSICHSVFLSKKAVLG